MRTERSVVGFCQCAFAALMIGWAGLPSVGATNWTALNQLARDRAGVPIRVGEPGTRPFWNGCAKAFIHPPAFEFKSVDGTIPTYFDNRGGSDWVNCMVYTALRLEDLAAATTHQPPTTL